MPMRYMNLNITMDVEKPGGTATPGSAAGRGLHSTPTITSEALTTA